MRWFMAAAMACGRA
uniref:Uncharacterized protein n=1 Tax=Arundo donax TaxID=35708 RepID=A0A0A9GTB4_ARUDO